MPLAVNIQKYEFNLIEKVTNPTNPNRESDKKELEKYIYEDTELYEKLVNYATRQGRSTTDAEVYINEAIKKTLNDEKVPLNFKFCGSLKTYLFKCIYCDFLDEIKKTKLNSNKKDKVLEEGSVKSAVQIFEKDEPNNKKGVKYDAIYPHAPDEDILLEEETKIVKIVRSALEKMSIEYPELAEVLYLRYYYDLSEKIIAVYLKKSERTIIRYINAAKKQIKLIFLKEKEKFKYK